MALTEMRQAMARNGFARIALGGKVEGFWGACSGIEEELRFAVEHRRPIYLLGGFGGMTSVLSRRVRERLRNQPSRSTGWAPSPDEFRNGLTYDQNERLMTTQVVDEAIELVLRGLAGVVEGREGREGRLAVVELGQGVEHAGRGRGIPRRAATSPPAVCCLDCCCPFVVAGTIHGRRTSADPTSGPGVIRAAHPCVRRLPRGNSRPFGCAQRC